MSIFPPEDLPNVSACKVALRVGQENLFCDQKFKIDKIFSKFLEIWTKIPSSSTMLSQGIFDQYLEWIRPFPTFQCPP